MFVFDSCNKPGNKSKTNQNELTNPTSPLAAWAACAMRLHTPRPSSLPLPPPEPGLNIFPKRPCRGRQVSFIGTCLFNAKTTKQYENVWSIKRKCWTVVARLSVLSPRSSMATNRKRTDQLPPCRAPSYMIFRHNELRLGLSSLAFAREGVLQQSTHTHTHTNNLLPFQAALMFWKTRNHRVWPMAVCISRQPQPNVTPQIRQVITLEVLDDKQWLPSMIHIMLIMLSSSLADSLADYKNKNILLPAESSPSSKAQQQQDASRQHAAESIDHIIHMLLCFLARQPCSWSLYPTRVHQTRTLDFGTSFFQLLFPLDPWAQAACRTFRMKHVPN